MPSIHPMSIFHRSPFIYIDDPAKEKVTRKKEKYTFKCAKNSVYTYVMLSEHISGNNMATGNRIVRACRIILIAQITGAKTPKQNCLRLVFCWRVGIMAQNPKPINYNEFRVCIMVSIN